jgi:hypothetical protein
MPKIRINKNLGTTGGFLGDVVLNSDTIVADVYTAVPAPGLVVDVDVVHVKGDAITVEQTSAATDEIALSGGSSGSRLTIYATEAFTLTVVAGSSEGICGGTDVQGVAIAAGSVVELIKNGSNWIAEEVIAAGTRAAAGTPA